jgi:putative nucleotidyltransferase with HDIG domain
MDNTRFIDRQSTSDHSLMLRVPSDSDSPFCDDSQPSPSIEELQQYIRRLENQLIVEKVRNDQLLSINEFNHRLEHLSELPVEAQLAATTVQAALKCGLACIMIHSPIENRLILLASAGPDIHAVSPHYRHSLTRGLMGRAIRSRKTLINQDGAPFQVSSENGSTSFLSQLVTPLYFNGFLEGVILLADLQPNAFDPAGIPYIEALSRRLLAAWDNDRFRQTLTELVQSSTDLSTTLNPEHLLFKIAEIARKSTRAFYTVVAVLDQHEWQIGTSGKISLLTEPVKPELLTLLDEVLHTQQALRLRDIRKDKRTSELAFNQMDLRTLLAVPICLDNASTGVILAFGRMPGVAFSDQDEFLIQMLSSQAAVSIERCLLDQELRSTLKSTQLLYDLSMRIAESNDLKSASQVIALTAFRLFQAFTCGLILFSADGREEVSVHYPSDDPSLIHPKKLIQQALHSCQISSEPSDDISSKVAIPIQTQRRCYGVLWLEIPDIGQHNHRPVEEMRILINQAAVALERSILLSETRHQANELSKAYTQLENSYEQTILALMKALDARDHETEEHTVRVTHVALMVGKRLGLSREELKALERGAMMHDIGKIGIKDEILLKQGGLSDKEWQIMRQHPAIGAQIIRDIPSLQDALPVIANHHERWDGTGYPQGLKGEAIPLLARIFSVADVYEAFTSDRPYRKKISSQEALSYLCAEAGKLFDAAVVDVLLLVLPDLNTTSSRLPLE